VLIHVGLAFMLTMLTALSLRRISRREAEGGGAAPAPAPPPAPAVQFPPLAALLDVPVPDTSTVPIGDSPTATSIPPPPPLVNAAPPDFTSRAVSDNPVLWRETRRPLFARRWQRFAASSVAIALLLFVYLLMSANNSLSERYAQIPFAFIFCGMLNILACVLSATAIAQEKESDTWTLLLATPLSARRIVIGKLLGIVRRLAPLCILITVHFLLFLIGETIDGITFLIILYLIFTTNIIWIATGLFLSLKIKRVTFAVMLNLAGPLVLYVLPFIILGITFSATRHDEYAQLVGLYCPYPYLGSAISHFNSAVMSRRQSLWMPVFGYVEEGEFLLGVVIAGLAHLIASGAIVYLTIRHFDRLVERAPQSLPLEAGPVPLITPG
jgi:ABC-type transport system involved in multi-copper enzyme maturation permease subunit